MKRRLRCLIRIDPLHPSIPYIRKLFILARLALVHIHSPIMLGQTSAIASLTRQPIRSPKYMNSEKVWAGIPAYSSVGLSSASWMEGNRAERVGMLKARRASQRQKHTERQDWLHGFIPIVANLFLPHGESSRAGVRLLIRPR